eukprot:926345-Prorocentrum_minimum.AAC.2
MGDRAFSESCDLQVEGETRHRDSMAPERAVTMELDKAAMATLVSTLSRVRDQLNVTAGA